MLQQNKAFHRLKVFLADLFTKKNRQTFIHSLCVSGMMLVLQMPLLGVRILHMVLAIGLTLMPLQLQLCSFWTTSPTMKEALTGAEWTLRPLRQGTLSST